MIDNYDEEIQYYYDKVQPVKTQSQLIREMTDKELKDEIDDLNYQIEQIQCYGISDIRYRDALEKELNKRNLWDQEHH